MNLVHGYGLNDLKNQSKTKAYATWADMLKRCYNPKYRNKDAYINTEVCEDWKTFSKFKSWFDEKYLAGYDLDKDIKDGVGNLYSPETCTFLPQPLNCLLVNVGGCKGFTSTKTEGVFDVSFSDCGNKRRVQIGRVIGKDKANKVYRINKFKHAVNKVQDYYESGDLSVEIYKMFIQRLITLLLLEGNISEYPSDVDKFNKENTVPKGLRLS